MPRPPILPALDWKHIFENGLTYAQWIAQGESPGNREKMEARRAAIVLEPHVRGLLAGLERTVHVVAIAEDWCGDVVRHAPVLQALAEDAPRLQVRFIARADSPDAFARFLTNGGEAIPKFVFFSDQFVECGNWGPMPEACRELIARGKALGDVGAARKRVDLLYDADANFRVVVAELVRLIDIAASRAL